MEKVKTILSFDIGINNLAYCLYDPVERSILDWGIINLLQYTSNESKHINDISIALVNALDEHFSKISLHTVLLENQPVQKNPTMKSIQMIIYSYFQIQKVHESSVSDVRFMSAINKSKWIPTVPEFKSLMLDLPEVEAKTAYKKNKTLSIQMATALLDAGTVVTSCARVRDVLDKAKKKDDICDALLQAVKHCMPAIKKSRQLKAPKVTLTV